MAASLPSLDLERELLTGDATRIVIAIDEVGRGALAGPVTIGAVAIDAQTPDAPTGVRDSKALSAKRRQALVPAVHAWVLAACVVDVPAERIDEGGIVRALGEGAVQAVRQVQADLASSSSVVLLDGHHDFVSPVDDSFLVRTVVKGDATCASIAAASIIAKVHRDALMNALDAELPHYGWKRNVGYGTAEHRRAISEFGASVHHRRSWRLLDESTLEPQDES